MPIVSVITDAQLDRSLGVGQAADRLAISVLGADALIGIAAHRTAAARIEAAVGRDILGESAPDDRAGGDPHGGDEAPSSSNAK